VLSFKLLRFLPWHSAFRLLSAIIVITLTQTSFAEVPREAAAFKRMFIKTYRQVWGLNNPAWLAAQIGQESGWRDGLTSSAGAKGMCQFIPATAAGVDSQYPGLASWSRYSPQWCAYAQALLMRELYRSNDDLRDPCNSMKFAGSAYNGGPTMLNREIALCKTNPNCDHEHWDENVATMNARAAWAWKENRTYVTRITQREKFYADELWGTAICEWPRR
jgi:membrane-bound lytic murein transglycosylase MltF